MRFIGKSSTKIDKTSEKKMIIGDQLIQDLIDFSGLEKDYIMKHLRREEKCTYSYEYKIRNPINHSELEWFYITVRSTSLEI
ncbi:hypothetical protein ES708_06811 [subsurface metagenome]